MIIFSLASSEMIRWKLEVEMQPEIQASHICLLKHPILSW